MTHLLDIGHVEVEGTRSVDDGLEGRIRDDGLVKGILLGNVFDNGEVELVFAVAGVCFCDLVGFFLGADGCDDAVAVFEEDVEDVGGDETGATGEKYACHGCGCGCGCVWCLGEYLYGLIE